jgi:hypothetical protein
LTTSYIWRATSGNLTRAGAAAANVIQFNEGAVTQNGYIFKSEFNVRISVPENERVDGDLNAVQDMGMDGIDVTITGMIEKARDDDESKIDYLMTWLKEAKVDSTFPKGKFGIELPDFPAFNVQPLNTGSAQYGYVLSSVRFIRDGDEVDKVGIIITLRYSGDKTGLGTP